MLLHHPKPEPPGGYKEDPIPSFAPFAAGSSGKAIKVSRKPEISPRLRAAGRQMEVEVLGTAGKRDSERTDQELCFGVGLDVDLKSIAGPTMCLTPKRDSGTPHLGQALSTTRNTSVIKKPTLGKRGRWGRWIFRASQQDMSQ